MYLVPVCQADLGEVYPDGAGRVGSECGVLEPSSSWRTEVLREMLGTEIDVVDAREKERKKHPCPPIIKLAELDFKFDWNLDLR
jgi:hypothetical protein